tara:strand:+ start:1041 stop:1208 length:168 start_codon:yes stop_codon:yes gene_type:complete
MLDKKDILLIKKALRISMIKFDSRYRLHNDIDARVLSNRFEKLLKKIKIEGINVR